MCACMGGPVVDGGGVRRPFGPIETCIICLMIHVYAYIYIYIERERERERGAQARHHRLYH